MLFKNNFYKHLSNKQFKLLGDLIRIIYIEYKNSKTPVFKSFSGLCTKILIKNINTKLCLENTLKNSKIRKKIFIFSNNIAKIYIIRKCNSINSKKLQHSFYTRFLRNNKNIKLKKNLLR